MTENEQQPNPPEPPKPQPPRRVMPANLKSMYSKAQSLLRKAETLYGKRDEGWEFIGVGFDENGPHIWFPDPLKNRVSILLNRTALAYPNQALYQLSHEVVHLLAPNRAPPTIIIEEGLAVKFSLEIPDYEMGYVAAARAQLPSNYQDALELANSVLEAAPTAVRDLRAVRPHFYTWTPDFISQEMPQLTGFAERICERRQMR